MINRLLRGARAAWRSLLVKGAYHVFSDSWVFLLSTHLKGLREARALLQANGTTATASISRR
jgi:hypothetical protein